MRVHFKISKAIFNFIEFFTIRYSGETFNSKGNNPSKITQKGPKEIFIEGNLINVEKTLKENKSLGEKFPGLAPMSWELMLMNKEGNLSTLKKGVISFDVSSNGEIIFSNGTYIIKLNLDKTEEEIDKSDLVQRIATSL